MEVDADKLCNMLGLEDLWNQYKAKLDAKDGGTGGGGDPFDSEPEGGGSGSGGGNSSGGGNRYQGLKALRLID